MTNQQKQVIIGLLLSDGCIRNPNKNKRNTGNCRFECTFKTACLDFILWLKFDILASLCTQSQPTPYPKDVPTQYCFSTRSSKDFTSLYAYWYVFDPNTGKRVKTIPKDLENVFTEISLAFLLMGDGYWGSSYKTTYICTENFTKSQVDLLIVIFRKNFDLLATKKKRNLGYRIRFSGKKSNLERLRKLVIPFFHPSMLYKLGI